MENCTNSLDCVDNSRNSILYKMYVSKDFMQKIESPNKKYALYLPKIFTRKKVKEKNQDNNSNSLIEEKSN